MATPDVALLPKRSLVRPLVQDGVVVSPVTIRNVPTTSSSLTQGTSIRNMPVQEIVLAVAPEEVAPLAEAMDLKYEITCVARSGRPASLPPPAAHPVVRAAFRRRSRPWPRPCWVGTARSTPDKAAPSPVRSEDGQPAEERNTGQGSRGRGHHARTGPYGAGALHGGHDRTESAIHALHRPGK